MEVIDDMSYVTLGDSYELIGDIVSSVENPVIVTDPPFNVRYHYRQYDDHKPEGAYWRDLASMFKLCPTCVTHYPEGIIRLAIEMGEVPERVMAWVYPSNTQRQHRDIAFWRVKPDFRRVRQPYRNMTDKRVQEVFKRTGGAKLYDWVEVNQVKNVSKEKTAHPCQMPEALLDKVVRLLPDGVTVIDPFTGSGTTGVACVRNGIPFVGIELDPEYRDIAEERIERAAAEARRDSK